MKKILFYFLIGLCFSCNRSHNNTRFPCSGSIVLENNAKGACSAEIIYNGSVIRTYRVEAYSTKTVDGFDSGDYTIKISQVEKYTFKQPVQHYNGYLSCNGYFTCAFYGKNKEKNTIQ